jgi:peptidoglycan/LPS O-acetylase OafA/YrhL
MRGAADGWPAEPRRYTFGMSGGREHSNSFDALRLLAAVAVVIGHSYVLTGIPGQGPLILGIASHSLGVAGFFVISGFLVTDSWLRNPAPSVYFSSRALRILPGLAFVVVITILVLGPILTTIPVGSYFTSGETWKYAANLLPFLPQYNLPGVFAHLPYPNAVNGSLWTLRAEIACYIVVGCLGLFAARLRPYILGAFGIAALAISLANITIAGSDLSAAATTWVFFAAAGVIRLISVRWKFVRIEIAAGVLVLWILLALFTPIDKYVLAWLALPYILLAIGQLSIPGVRRAARFGDMSYGIYLWAFPVQQSLIYFGAKLPIWADIAVVTVISAAIAMVSWHLVESPALRIKRRIMKTRKARLEQDAAAPTPAAENAPSPEAG